MIISKPFRKFILHTSIYINKKDNFHVVLNLNTEELETEQDPSWILVFVYAEHSDTRRLEVY